MSQAKVVPELSVIIPVYATDPASVNLLRKALDHLKASSFQDFEILVADDFSPQGEAVRAAAQEAGAELVRLDQRRGPAAARNAAVERAAGDVLVFMDADTSAHPDTLNRFARKFRERPELDAAIGSYDPHPSAPGVVSRFRNLLHCYVHQHGNRSANTFWAGCGAVRKSRFRALGGFDESFPGPSIEDVEFGLRLRQAGGSIELDPQIQVTHHKAWTLRSMVRTDLFSRAIPWAGILHKYPMPLDLNFKAGDRISGALTALTLAVLVIAILHGGVWWIAPIVSLAVIAILNWPLFRFLARSSSWGRAVVSFPLLLVYFATCVVGLIAGLGLAEHRRDRWLWPAAAMIGVALLAVQIAGGAFEAEFTAHPDEPAQFVSGLMVHDYLAALPRENPIEWAGQYYLHYPKVAIGHWPPGYHAMEAVWWLFLGPSRTTAMLLQWLTGVVALTLLYRLSRSMLSLPITMAILALAIATPVFQQSLEQTMADLSCLLWSVLVMQAAVRLIEKKDEKSFLLLLLWLLAATLTKGTAACLVPVAAIAVLASPKRLWFSLRLQAASAGCFLVAAAWYLPVGSIQSEGGMTLRMPWHAELIGHLAGWGFAALAVLGLQKKPLALIAGSLIVSTLGVSFVVRAMQEERHWIIALPAILLLSGMAISRFPSRWIAVGLLVAAVAFFPFAWYRQSRSEFGDLARQIVRPSRMLVSSASFGEGPWIAVAGLAERRPGSFIVRASKVLAESGWNGEGYHLLTTTGDAVSRRLDELALDIVILHIPAGQNPWPHHVLLQDTIRASAAWRLCGSAQDLQAYCRIEAPRVPRKPLQMRILGWDFKEQIQ